MEFPERAKRFVVSMIASALNTTIAIVERMLPFRVDWLERIQILVAEFNAVAADATDKAGGRDARRETAPPVAADADRDVQKPEPLIAAYDALWQFAQKTRMEGLRLDDEFCARVEKSWSTRTLLAYMRSAENSLKERAEKAQTAANESMISDHRG